MFVPCTLWPERTHGREQLEVVAKPLHDLHATCKELRHGTQAVHVLDARTNMA